MEFLNAPAYFWACITIFISTIVLVIGIREFVERREKERLRLAEIQRRRMMKQKVEEARKRQEYLRQEQLTRKRKELEKSKQEQMERMKREEERKRKLQRLAMYQTMLNNSYKGVSNIVDPNELHNITKNYTQEFQIPVNAAYEGFEVREWCDEEKLHHYIVGLFALYQSSFGETITNLAKSYMNAYITSNKLQEQLKDLVTLVKFEQLVGGISYLVEEEAPTRSYKLFLDCVEHGAHGICITRQAPNTIHEKCKLDFNILWLAKMDDERATDPTDLERLMRNISVFLGEDGHKIVLLDCLEYLITQNNYTIVLRFIQSLESQIALKNSTLVVPINPSALEPRQLALLERDLHVLRYG